MEKIEQDIYLTIDELGAMGEVVIPPIDMNNLRIERDEYLAQTASDLYDRVVYMVRKENLEYDPELDENEEGPLVSITLTMGVFSMSTAFWRDTRRERQNRIKELVNELFQSVLRMKKNLDDIIREEEEEAKKKV